MNEHRCCGYWMVRRFDPYAFLTYPFVLKSTWWCPLCGKRLSAPTLTGRDEKAVALQEWRDINGLPRTKEAVSDE